jgi:hypothetical protein
MFIKFRKSTYCESDIYLIFLGIIVLSIVVPSLGSSYVISPLLDFCVTPLTEQYLTPILTLYLDSIENYFFPQGGFLDTFMMFYSENPTTLNYVKA